jgi:hypothetical protein
MWALLRASQPRRAGRRLLSIDSGGSSAVRGATHPARPNHIPERTLAARRHGLVDCKPSASSGRESQSKRWTERSRFSRCGPAWQPAKRTTSSAMARPLFTALNVLEGTVIAHAHQSRHVPQCPRTQAITDYVRHYNRNPQPFQWSQPPTRSFERSGNLKKPQRRETSLT